MFGKATLFSVLHLTVFCFSLVKLPTTYGISFPVDYLNASTAYVRCFLDGSVLVTHGATEMGQGVNTKMQAIAARELGAELDKVRKTGIFRILM